MTTDRKGNANSAYNFDGNSYINIPYSQSFAIKQNVSVGAWVKISNYSTYDNIVFINLIDPDAWGFQLSLAPNAKPFLCCDIYYSDYRSASDNSLTLNQWYYILGVRNATSMKIYVNGVLSKEITVPSNDMRTTTNSLSRIGRPQSTNTNLSFKGLVDDIRIYNRALTDAEILQLYNE